MTRKIFFEELKNEDFWVEDLLDENCGLKLSFKPKIDRFRGYESVDQIESNGFSCKTGVTRDVKNITSTDKGGIVAFYTKKEIEEVILSLELRYGKNWRRVIEGTKCKKNLDEFFDIAREIRSGKLKQP